jgi:hypothetical protein
MPGLRDDARVRSRFYGGGDDVRKLWWRLQYSYHFWLRARWQWSSIWEMSASSLENADNDTSEDAESWVEEDISCWGSE